MTIDWQRVLPVIASILIISVAVVRQYSKALAPILATMPINIPLAMWILYEPNDQGGMTQFIRDMSINDDCGRLRRLGRRAGSAAAGAAAARITRCVKTFSACLAGSAP